MGNTNDFFQVVDRETLTVSNAVVAFNTSKLDKKLNGGNVIKKAEFYVEDADVRLTRDGTTPVGSTTDTGTLLTSGAIYAIEGEADLKASKFIRNSGSDAKLQVSYLTYQGVGGG